MFYSGDGCERLKEARMQLCKTGGQDMGNESKYVPIPYVKIR